MSLPKLRYLQSNLDTNLVFTLNHVRLTLSVTTYQHLNRNQRNDPKSINEFDKYQTVNY